MVVVRDVQCRDGGNGNNDGDIITPERQVEILTFNIQRRINGRREQRERELKVKDVKKNTKVYNKQKKIFFNGKDEISSCYDLFDDETYNYERDLQYEKTKNKPTGNLVPSYNKVMSFEKYAHACSIVSIVSNAITLPQIKEEDVKEDVEEKVKEEEKIVNIREQGERVVDEFIIID